MGSTILYLLTFCLCFHSTVALNETIKYFQYQDILRHAAQIGNFDYQQHISANLQKVEVVKNLFYDPELDSQNSKTLTPWKLLHDGAQTWKSSNSSIWSLTAGCTEGIQETAQGLKQRSPWAIRMIDATGKPGSNIEGGNIVWIGSLSECLDIRAVDNTTEKYLFKGQYSIVVFIPPGPVRQIFPGFGPILGITLGLCTPSTCTPTDIQTLLYYGTKSLSVLTNHTIQAGVLSTHPGSRPPLSTSAIAVITLLSVIGFSILLGTLYDVCLHRPALEKAKTAVLVVEPPEVDHLIGDEDHPINVQDYTPLLREREEERRAITQSNQKSVPMRILLAFSAYSNGQKILNTNRTPGTLDCVHGIRFLSMTWVILGHTIFFLVNVVSNLRDLAVWTQRWTFQAIMNAQFSVDSFFVLSGTLVSYLLLKELRNKNGPLHINWALLYFHRFWRLTLVYMIILGINTALFIYMGDGPAWPFATGPDHNCEHYWWTNLLYINNFFGMKKQCMGWSWYLANDMQFFVIAPFVIIGFYFKWFVGAAMSLVLILVNFVSTAVIVLHTKSADNFIDVYIKPWCRIGPYVVGIVTGYLLYISEKNAPRLHKGVVVLGWALAAACNLAVLYGLYEYNSGKAVEYIHVNALYQACSRTAWGLGLAWVIFACCRGYGGYVNTILSWPGIIPLSRLTYTAYLVHPIVLSYYNYSLQQSIVFNNIVYIWMFLGGLTVSYGVAFIASLAFEAPMMALEKVIFPRN